MKKIKSFRQRKVTNKIIGEEMFLEIRNLFPEFDYSRALYKKYWRNPNVDELIDFAYSRLAQSVGLKLTDYGWYFRNSVNPEIGL
ncbi:hypothetical protein [Lactococcus lactis]